MTGPKLPTITMPAGSYTTQWDTTDVGARRFQRRPRCTVLVQYKISIKSGFSGGFWPDLWSCAASSLTHRSSLRVDLWVAPLYIALQHLWGFSQRQWRT